MNNVLFDAFRHNSWATKLLLTTCQQLSEQQLASSTIGGYGSIINTFNHVILSDARYLQHISGVGSDWLINRESSNDLTQLLARVEETQQGWERLFAEPIDAERLLILDQGTYEVYVGVVIAQALHHGNSHREQINAILTHLGIEAPDIQAWAYCMDTGRGRERHNAQ